MYFFPVILAIFLLYGVLILYCWQSWRSMPVMSTPVNDPVTTVSVIIAARNEEQQIGKLLTALQQQTFPASLLEVIVVDDHSTDGTVTVVQQFSFVRLISLQTDPINSYKKKAIETGIAAATGQLIVTTDADCVPGRNWLKALVSYKEKQQAVFVAAPVVLEDAKGLLPVFQCMDFLVLQGITGATVYHNRLSMCNGANLAYERDAFYTVNGFSGIDHIASGDDMLLMHKMSQAFPGRILYLKSIDAIVATLPMHSWSSFFNQRIRWASKARFYSDKRITAVLVLVYMLNLSFVVLFVAGFFDRIYFLEAAILCVAKALVELPFFISVARFFNKQRLATWFFLFQPLHIFYTILTGLLSQFGSYEWKGRKVK